MTTLPGYLQDALMVLVFVIVALLAFGLAPYLSRGVDIEKRLGTGQVVVVGDVKKSLRSDASRSVWARTVTWVEKHGLSLADTKSDAVRAKLVLAGFTSAYAPRMFVFARIALTVSLPLGVLVPLFMLGATAHPGKMYLWISGMALAGFYLPSFYVDHRTSKRREQLLNGFPDTLDLMLVCVEAGLGIDACFARVGGEIVRSHPLLAAQFDAVGLELRAGRSREDALRGLAKRSGLPEITAFVTLLVQAQRLGSSISQALKIYSIEMREGRRMRAEEKAHRLPVLLSIPLVVFMLPTMMSVLMLPGVIMVMRNVLPKLS